MPFLLKGVRALARLSEASTDAFWSGEGGRPPLPDFGRLLHLRTSVSEAESISYSASRRIGQILHLRTTTDVGMSVDSYGKSSSVQSESPPTVNPDVFLAGAGPDAVLS